MTSIRRPTADRRYPHARRIAHLEELLGRVVGAVTDEWPVGLVQTFRPASGKGTVKLLLQQGTPEERARAKRFRGD